MVDVDVESCSFLEPAANVIVGACNGGAPDQLLHERSKLSVSRNSARFPVQLHQQLQHESRGNGTGC